MLARTDKLAVFMSRGLYHFGMESYSVAAQNCHPKQEVRSLDSSLPSRTTNVWMRHDRERDRVNSYCAEELQLLAGSLPVSFLIGCLCHASVPRRLENERGGWRETGREREKEGGRERKREVGTYVSCCLFL